MQQVTLPENFEDICETLKEEVFEAFKVYFNEECLETYIRSIYEWDYVGMEEVLVDNDKFLDEYIRTRLQDEM